jgi:hypothetical protein
VAESVIVVIVTLPEPSIMAGTNFYRYLVKIHYFIDSPSEYYYLMTETNGPAVMVVVVVPAAASGEKADRNFQ